MNISIKNKKIKNDSINKIRTFLLIQTDKDLNNKQHLTLVNSKTKNEFEELMSQHIYFQINTNYRSQQNIIKNYIEQAEKTKKMYASRVSLRDIYKNMNKFEDNNENEYFEKFRMKVRQSISKKKLDFNSKNLGITQTLENRFTEGKETKNENKIKFLESLDRKNNYDKYDNKINGIIEFLNNEKGIFINENTQTRCKYSFYYLKNLCLNFKQNEEKIKKIKRNVGFNQIKNILLIKENISDENKIKKNCKPLLNIDKYVTEQRSKTTKAKDQLRKSFNFDDPNQAKFFTPFKRNSKKHKTEMNVKTRQKVIFNHEDFNSSLNKFLESSNIPSQEKEEMKGLLFTHNDKDLKVSNNNKKLQFMF